MTSTLRSVAETRFAAITRREQTAMSEVEAELQHTREKTARLKALRLASAAQTPVAQAAKLAGMREA